MASRIDIVGQNGNDGLAYAGPTDGKRPNALTPDGSFWGQSGSEDMVNRPPHYQSQSGIECIDAIRAQMTDEEFRGYCKGNVAKYLWRWREKGGVESLRKAKWYLDKMIEDIVHD